MNNVLQIRFHGHRVKWKPGVTQDNNCAKRLRPNSLTASRQTFSRDMAVFQVPSLLISNLAGRFGAYLDCWFGEGERPLHNVRLQAPDRSKGQQQTFLHLHMQECVSRLHPKIIDD